MLSNVLFDEGKSCSPMCFLTKDNQCFALNASIIILHHQTLKTSLHCLQYETLNTQSTFGYF